MSIATLILGESGTGKTTALRNLPPNDTILIQPHAKPLPFRCKIWSKDSPDGMIVQTLDKPDAILHLMSIATRPIIVIDDWQYILANQFMARRNERSYDKFTDIGGAGFDICKKASELKQYQRVYVMAHTHTGDDGKIRIKTLGKLLDDKIVIEGMFTTVLRTQVENGQYFFSTQNNGGDTVKSPMGMFEASRIPNDIKLVDDAICDFYGIQQPQQPQQKEK